MPPNASYENKLQIEIIMQIQINKMKPVPPVGSSFPPTSRVYHRESVRNDDYSDDDWMMITITVMMTMVTVMIMTIGRRSKVTHSLVHV